MWSEKWWLQIRCAKIGSCDRFKGTKEKKKRGAGIWCEICRHAMFARSKGNCLDYPNVHSELFISCVRVCFMCECTWSPSHEIPDHGWLPCKQEKAVCERQVSLLHNKILIWNVFKMRCILGSCGVFYSFFFLFFFILHYPFLSSVSWFPQAA